MHVWIGRQISKAFVCLPVSLRTCKTFFYFNALIISNIYGLYCGCAESTLTVVGFIQLIDIGLDFATWFKNKLKKIPKSKKRNDFNKQGYIFSKVPPTILTDLYFYDSNICVPPSIALLLCWADDLTTQQSCPINYLIIGSISFWDVLETLGQFEILWECTRILLLISVTLDKSDLMSLKSILDLQTGNNVFLWSILF